MTRINQSNGVLIHEDVSPDSIAQMRRELVLFEKPVELDHFVVTLRDSAHFFDYQAELRKLGGKIIEGPGVWPGDFCNGDTFSDDLSMNFASVLLTTGVIAVLAAPHRASDQLDRFRIERGEKAIHHVAIVVSDFEEARATWLEESFSPLSRFLDDGNLAQQFLHNHQGQILELIKRRNQSQATFTCDNLKGLRLSEEAGK
jgi:hypothetical protein